MLRSRNSMASERKMFPANRCSIRPSNLSFMLTLLRAGLFPDSVLERFPPGGLHFSVALAEALPNFMRRHGGDHAGGVDHIGRDAGMHHRAGGAVRRRE